MLVLHSNENLRNQQENPPAQRKLPDAMLGMEAEHDEKKAPFSADPRGRSSRDGGVLSYAEEAD